MTGQTLRQRTDLRLVAKRAADSRAPKHKNPRIRRKPIVSKSPDFASANRSPDAVGIAAIIALACVIAALLWIALTGARL